MCEEILRPLFVKNQKKRTETLNYRPSKFFLCSFVQRENPFFFHLFHHRCLKDTRRKEKEKRDRETEREREGHTQNWGEREGCARETTREENVEWTKIIIIHYYYILGF